MKYPGNIKTGKGKLAFFLFWNLYVFELGKNKILGRPLTFLPEITSVYLLLKFLGIYDAPASVVIPVVIGGVVFAWVLGKVYMHYNLDQIENIVHFERNPHIKDMHENMGKNNRRF